MEVYNGWQHALKWRPGELCLSSTWNPPTFNALDRITATVQRENPNLDLTTWDLQYAEVNQDFPGRTGTNMPWYEVSSSVSERSYTKPAVGWRKEGYAKFQGDAPYQAVSSYFQGWTPPEGMNRQDQGSLRYLKTFFHEVRNLRKLKVKATRQEKLRQKLNPHLPPKPPQSGEKVVTYVGTCLQVPGPYQEYRHYSPLEASL